MKYLLPFLFVGCASCPKLCFKAANHSEDLKDLAEQSRYLTKKEIVTKIVDQAQVMELEQEMCE